jgi:hypothetical protein
MLSHRDVLAAPAGAGLAWASQASAPARAQRGRRIIVDSQVHIWPADSPERLWPADGIGQAHIPRPFTYYELSARMDEAGRRPRRRAALVEGYHNEHAMEAAKKWPRKFALMAACGSTIRNRRIEGLLATWKAQLSMLGPATHLQPPADRLAH